MVNWPFCIAARYSLLEMPMTTEPPKHRLQQAQFRPKTIHPNAGLHRREAIIGLLFLSPWILGFVLLKLLPILYTLGYSFTNFNMLNPKGAAFVDLENYIHFVTDLNAWSSLVLQEKMK